MLPVFEEIVQCPDHKPLEYGFDILEEGAPEQVRHICPLCGNSRLDLAKMRLKPYRAVPAIARCIDGN